MTKFEPIACIDTLDLAKAFVHFAPSYSLDVVSEIVQTSYQLPQELAIIRH
ncbi:MAG: hypothetical protein H6765_02095 [Candidatus Peribacteria bacterium]|nr:MAG: hypothetical protein H6765_02095 [Candidatus Peribacteria bacterium]